MNLRFSSFLRVDSDHFAHYRTTLAFLVSLQSVDSIYCICNYMYLSFQRKFVTSVE